MSRNGAEKRRKVQRLGTSTLGVTVPADWTRRNGIEKGDDLLVQRDESGGSLLLVPDRSDSAESEATIDADAFDADRLERAIITEYVLGRQLVRIESAGRLDNDCLDAVLDVERRLMGLAVIEEMSDRIVVRCSVAPDDFELPTLLGRFGNTEATMRETAIEALVGNDEAAARRVLDRRGRVEKLLFLFLRLLFDTYRNPRLNEVVGLETGFPLIGYRSIAQDTVLMADIARDIARLTVERDVSALDGQVVDVLRRLETAIDEAATATRAAATNPTHERVSAAFDTLPKAERCGTDANDYLDTERPEPLLTLQRAVLFLQRDVRHVGDSLDVAARLALRHEATLDDPE